MSNVFSYIITSGHNQNIILLIEAKPGKGKSYAAMDLAVWLSYKLQKKFGGKPWDYFNIGHMGIIMPDEVLRLAANVKQYGIYIFDDFGIAYSAREWHSDANKAMNGILETMRTKNNILIMTVPDATIIDKIGREILHFKIVMHQSMFDLGVTLGKLTMEEKQYNTQSKKILHPYLKNKTEIYNYALFGKPPKELCAEYDARRLVQLKRLDERSINTLKQKEADALANFGGDGKTSKKQAAILNRDACAIALDHLMATGHTADEAYIEIKKANKGDIPSMRTLQRQRKKLCGVDYPDTPMTRKTAKSTTTTA
jgi:hypothetical protein